jgi:hypothetical protein
MDDYIKVEGRADLGRPVGSRAVINVDHDAYLAAQAQRQQIVDSQSKIQALEDRITILEHEVSELTSILKEVIQCLRN